MNAPEQLTLFEPVGAEVAKWALSQMAASDAALKRAANLRDRGFGYASAYWSRVGCELASAAATFEAAYQFEQLAGLS